MREIAKLSGPSAPITVFQDTDGSYLGSRNGSPFLRIFVGIPIGGAITLGLFLVVMELLGEGFMSGGGSGDDGFKYSYGKWWVDGDDPYPDNDPEQRKERAKSAVPDRDIEEIPENIIPPHAFYQYTEDERMLKWQYEQQFGEGGYRSGPHQNEPYGRTMSNDLLMYTYKNNYPGYTVAQLRRANPELLAAMQSRGLMVYVGPK